MRMPLLGCGSAVTNWGKTRHEEEVMTEIQAVELLRLLADIVWVLRILTTACLLIAGCCVGFQLFGGRLLFGADDD